MKKYLLLFIFILIFTNNSFAFPKYGIVVGTNVEKMDYKNFEPKEYHYLPGFIMGMFGEKHIASLFSLTLELAYNYSRNEYVYYSTDEMYVQSTYTKQYLSLPILFKMNLIQKLDLQLGIQAIYNLVGMEYASLFPETEYKAKGNITSKMRKNDNFFCIGLGKEFDVLHNNYRLDLRFLKGINDNTFLPKEGMREPWKLSRIELLFGMEL